jgi:hypothetical protein
LELDARTLAGAGDPREPAMRIIERDRRRIWWQTAVTIALWVAALVMVLWMLVALALLMPFEAHLRDMITVGITCTIGVLALAAGSTVLLVLATRRATLRQINASLLEISEQLKQLRK